MKPVISTPLDQIFEPLLQNLIGRELGYLGSAAWKSCNKRRILREGRVTGHTAHATHWDLLGATVTTIALLRMIVDATELIVTLEALQTDVAILTPIIAPGILDQVVLVQLLGVHIDLLTKALGNNCVVDDGVPVATSKHTTG